MFKRRQGIFWIATIKENEYNAPKILPKGLRYIVGQRERGATGYQHWQLFFATESKLSLKQIKALPHFAETTGHFELSRSTAADTYCQKEETRVGDRFELGEKPILRSSKTDWDSVWALARGGRFTQIPAQIRVCHFGNLTRIAGRYQAPRPVLRTCHVYWGPSRTGKSYTAWTEAGMEAYPKDPRTKFWCGYNGEDSVVVDEFRGGIDVSHLLRWLDRYPVRVEIKGSAVPLECSQIWITSNLDPRAWYPDLDPDTQEALLNRLKIKHFLVSIFPQKKKK